MTFERRFKSGSMEWSTPESLWKPLDDEFHFTCDLAASPANNKCALYWSIQDDALKQSWDGVCWCNPPYGKDLKQWVKKGYEESLKGATIVMLLPVRTSSEYWWKYIFGHAEVRFIRGNIRFSDAPHGLSTALAIVIWRNVG